MKFFSTLIVVLSLVPSLASAQAAAPAPASTPDTPKTIEEKRLQGSSIEVQVIASLVAENGRAEKIRALEYIRNMIDKGRATPASTDVVDLLGELGGEGTTKQVVENRRIINDFPEVRRESAELLGRIGGDQARETLLTIATQDREPMVISEAVYSLGLIGGGNQLPRVLAVITSLIRAQDAVRPDSNFAYAAVSSLEMLAKANNGQVGPDAMAALVQVQNGNYIRPVREKAKAILDSLVKF